MYSTMDVLTTPLNDASNVHEHRPGRIYVGNLNWNVTEQHLTDFFRNSNIVEVSIR
jgi:RNA recognition motif-containing protein